MKKMEEREIENSLKLLLATVVDFSQLEMKILDQSGSDRRYYRLLTDNGSFIGTYTPDKTEGECFVGLARAFRAVGRSVPEILAVSDDWHVYIQEDLGSKTLFSLLGQTSSTEYIKETLIRLVSLQKTPEKLWAGKCQCAPFCRRQAVWDLNYFKYEFLKPSEVIFDEDRLEDDFEKMAKKLVEISEEFSGFMMRDCQSRNVMISSDRPVFIDFQGGRKGPVLYDAVSFLWQARAGFSNVFRKQMIDIYSDIFCEGDSEKKRRMLSSLDDIVLFRTLQVLGAYGFRGLVQRKAHFLLSIPGALSNLEELLTNGSIDNYPELKRCCESLLTKHTVSSDSEVRGLTVEVFSFSYKKGYPDDRSGNGGGFMFDCRALHNPGRYAQYKSLTGRDRPVIEFLEKRGEIQAFLKSAWSITDAAIERYVTRGFTRLQIGFGCTGGQHRSVYSAEKTAAHIAEVFPEVNVRLIHREHPEEPMK